MTQKKKTGISRLLEFGGRYRWMTVVACILSGLSSVLMLCPFLCIWLVLRNVLAALPDLSTVDVEAMTLYGWAALGLAVGGFLPIWGRSTRPKICSPRSCTIWLRSHWVFSPRTAAANCGKSSMRTRRRRKTFWRTSFQIWLDQP